MLVLPALWTDIQLGILHRLLTLHCQEELLSYLHNIYLYWSYILDGNKGLMQAVDIFTCRQLQCRAPTISKIDQAFIESGMVTKILFPQIQNSSDRERLLKQILSIQTPSQIQIPTLFTLFENLKFLEVPATILKSLLDRKPHDKTYPISIYQAFKSIYHSDQDLRVRYQRLWFFAIIRFVEMVPTAPKKEKKKVKPTIKEPNPIVWGKLARMALNFGFDSLTIREMISASQQGTIEKVQRLIRVHPHFESHVTLVTQVFDAIDESNLYQQYDTDWNERNIVDESIERRLGRPFEVAYYNNFTLEFDNPTIQNGVVTSELVLRTIFCAFFGDLSTQTISLVAASSTPAIAAELPRQTISLAASSSSTPAIVAELPQQTISLVAESSSTPPTIAEFQLQPIEELAEARPPISPEDTVFVSRGLFTVHIKKRNQARVTLTGLSWVKIQSILYDALNNANEAYVIEDKEGYILSQEQVEREEEIFLIQIP